MAAKKTSGAESPPPGPQKIEQVRPTSGATTVKPVRYAELVEKLQTMNSIKNDAGEDVPFSGNTKKDFIQFCVEGYTRFGKLVVEIYQTARFLHTVRETLKESKLFLTWLNYAGFPTSTAYVYLRLYERFDRELREFYFLGVKKLLAIARLPDCRDYVRKQESELAVMPATEVEKRIREEIKRKRVHMLKAGTKTKSVGRKRRFEIINDFILRPSIDGTKITVEQLDPDSQRIVLEKIKELLSQIKR